MVLENVSSLDINYLFGSMANLLALSAVTAGALFQTIIKWWDKWQDGQPIPFDKKFLGTAIGSFIGALAVAIPLLNAGVEVLNQNIPIYGLIMAWFITAGWSYALNNGVNGVVTKLEQRGENRLLKSDRLQAMIDRAVENRVSNNNGAQSNKGSSTEETTP